MKIPAWRGRQLEVQRPVGYKGSIGAASGPAVPPPRAALCGFRGDFP